MLSPMRTTLAALMAAVAAAPAMAATLTGPAEVIDGDTLTIAGRDVRLFGIDAPEAAQTCDRNGEVWACGEEATRQLKELVGAGEVQCLGSEVDQYGRLLAVCHVGRFELNKTMVEQGWATAFRNYSDNYVADETRAKMARRGIWTSTFDLPQNFRLAQRPQPAEQPRSVQTDRTSAQSVYQGGCRIKGNRSRRGDWIYHLPGMPYYDATRAEEMFCSEVEAQAAGYRRAIVR
jgi:endonuclease YncB( thermonuclease family)